MERKELAKGQPLDYLERGDGVTCSSYKIISSKPDTLTNVGLVLGHRRRRSTNIKPTQGQRFVFAGLSTPE